MTIINNPWSNPNLLPTMTIMEAVSRGLLPLNAQVVAINGAPLGGNGTFNQSPVSTAGPCPTIASILSGGFSGAMLQGSVPTPANNGAPVNVSDPQRSTIFVADLQGNGQQYTPAPKDTAQPLCYSNVTITPNTLCGGLIFTLFGSGGFITGPNYGGN